MTQTESVTTQPAESFLRWAGGKTWLTKRIDTLFSDLNYNNYHEPFLGGASIFFKLSPPCHSFLSDKNPSLIETYTAIRDNPKKVIRHLRKYKNTETFYYNIRNKKLRSTYSRAAQFIFLNQTSFNGIYRVNLNGEYNVPYGYRQKPFLNEALLHAASNALANTTLTASGFDTTINNINEGDLVFLDPPYTVSHNNNGFIKYNKSLFSIEDQKKLSEYIEMVKSQGAHYVLTNAAHNTIRAIFNNGDHIIELTRASLIGGKKAQRGLVSELLITNMDVSK